MTAAAKVGVVMLVALAVLGYFILRIEDINLRKSGQMREVKVVFDNAAGLEDEATVRIGGVRKGHVTNIQSLPDGSERLAAFREAERIGLAYMPYKYILNRLTLDMTQKRVIGYRRPVFWQDWWHFVDLDDAAAGAAKKA
jgi:hypothetical protein